VNKFLAGLRRFVSKNVMFIALLVLCVILSVLSPRFFTFRNFMNVIMQSTTMGIVAVGMTFVIITGGIDLSVGSVLAFSAAIGAGVMMKVGLPIPVAIVLMILVGAFFGLAHGLLISRLNLPAFIVTLGGMSIARGFTMVFMQGQTIRGLSPAFQFIGNGQVIGIIPCAALILVVVYFIANYVLKYTTYGRSVYALGGNREATALSGINSKRVETIAFVISGITCGLGAIILDARLGTAVPTAGEGLELDAIGAVVIGGASLSGGRGTILGTLVGVFILGIISNGLNLLNVDPFFQGVVRGAVILIAVLIDTIKRQ
jgi:ribose transport system permease protein